MKNVRQFDYQSTKNKLSASYEDNIKFKEAMSKATHETSQVMGKDWEINKPHTHKTGAIG